MRVVAIAAIVCAARVAAADHITVTVVDVAGDTAFIQPGRAAGIVPGSKIRIGAHDFVVVEAAERTAAIALHGAMLATGDTGDADSTPGRPDETTKLPPPRALAAFKDQWPAPAPPAAGQRVAELPLGQTHTSGARLAVYGHAYGTLAKDDSSAQGEARVVTSFSAMNDHPLGADLDAAVRGFSDGWNKHERTPLFVRAAQLRYGDPADPALIVGRLRYAATSIGMLDGGRAALHTGNLELAAFGGLVPDPVGGKPETGAARFGGELIYDRAEASWQPRFAVAVHGSTWNGQLDERRLSLAASAHHGATWLDGWFEAQQFPADNPWGAHPLEVTGAGASAEWRHAGDHVGVDLTFLRPERSLRLASFLSPDWLCARSPLPGEVAESCMGHDYWSAATASAGTRGAAWSLDAVGSLGQTHSVTDTFDATGYLRGELGRRLRLVVAASGGHASFATWYAADVGFAVSPSPRFDAELTYRPERLDYIAATGAFFMQSLVADLHRAISQATDVALEAIATTGADRDVLATLVTFAWRPQ